ncbi:Endonuclease/Exonuclease/phosphatase family protein [Jannaschia seosinensis]|uniref:Endonuclease/Exonuclease/phosphatase family protein n=1 Tax=Jannaschia seosinensis TaxID=313367 RepID=A0A0M7BBF2_9RHOB|nr:endonuclease/exonuclease/phosphatase family protein [Jannaschia seosinensis]CUH39398.1 Endonuclease/Exonuclease/phosphatase family protein [Jannaschia seosinensis]
MRLLTWNIRFAFGLDMRPSARRILDALDVFAPDIVCLQEAEARFGGRPSSLPLDEVAARGWTPVRPAGAARNLGYRGNAILLRSGWKFSDIRHLPLRGFETRGVLMARLQGPNGGFSLACIHLGLLGFHRQAQLRAVTEALGEMEGPHLIVGDTNEWRRGVDLHVPAGWTSHDAGPTYPSRWPVFRLDRILAGPGLAVEDLGVPPSGYDRRASDHLPVAATVAPG